MGIVDDASHAEPAIIDFAAHARSLGAEAEKVDSIAALARQRSAD